MARYSFPSDFLWAAATSAHQVEGHNTHSDWWAWEQAGRVKASSGAACDHYRRFEADFDLAAALGHRAHRFSIEWARIEPEPGKFDDQALAHYRAVLEALRRRNLTPLVTLHHFTTPQWVMQAGGWPDRRVVDWFARYVDRVVTALGPLATYWITINEPMVFVNMHYIQGIGPPGVRDFRQALRVIEHLIRAHAAAYDILHRAQPEACVSIAKHMPVFAPHNRWSVMDRIATGRTDRIFNTAFLEAVTAGVWSMPGVGTWRIPDAKDSLDFLGINFYGRQFIRWSPGPGGGLGGSCDLGHHPKEVPERTSFGWDVHPASFKRTILRGASYGVPVFITENGTWMDDDARRWRFIQRHLAAVAEAMQEGAKVLGFCYWSLLDNFEWADGFTPRFGLIEVDYRTQERRIRDSATRYAEVCRTGSLTVEE